MLPKSAQPRPATKAARSKKAAAIVFALCGLAALAVSAYFGRQRYLQQNPPPLPNVIAPIPPGEEMMIRTGMSLLGRTVLKLDAEQQKKLDEIWSKTPRSVDEVIKMQQATDKILTPDQIAKLRPIRKRAQDQIVDKMLEPARERMLEADFEKFSNEVKIRVDRRINGQ